MLNPDRMPNDSRVDNPVQPKSDTEAQRYKFRSIEEKRYMQRPQEVNHEHT